MAQSIRLRDAYPLVQIKVYLRSTYLYFLSLQTVHGQVFPVGKKMSTALYNRKQISTLQFECSWQHQKAELLQA